jgi:hypothetical protein
MLMRVYRALQVSLMVSRRAVAVQLLVHGDVVVATHDNLRARGELVQKGREVNGQELPLPGSRGRHINRHHHQGLTLPRKRDSQQPPIPPGEDGILINLKAPREKVRPEQDPNPRGLVRRAMRPKGPEGRGSSAFSQNLQGPLNSGSPLAMQQMRLLNTHNVKMLSLPEVKMLGKIASNASNVVGCNAQARVKSEARHGN